MLKLILRSLVLKLILILAGMLLLTVLIVVAVSAQMSAALARLAVAQDAVPADLLADQNRAVILAAALGGLLALVLGAVLLWRVTAPLRQLRAVAAGLAAGDLSQRAAPTAAGELGELGRTLNRLAGRLQRIELAHHRAVADIARDLRGPLSRIQDRVVALKEGSLPLDQSQLEPIRLRAIQISNLVGDLEGYVQAEAGMLTLDSRPLTLLDVASQVLAGVEAAAVEKGVYLSLEHSGNLPVIAADVDRLRQVFRNLLESALQNTPSGGTIRVDLVLRDADTVQASVTDSGDCIPPQHLAHAFDHLYQAGPPDSDHRRIGGGASLGLTMSRYIVEAHGGQIWVESPVNRGKGARVIFTLPVSNNV